jgi:hypothetical protein
MKSICIRIISLIAPIGLGVVSVAASPSVSVAATAQPFEGTFSSAKVTLQLRYEASTSHYVGALMVGNDLFPVDGTVAGTSFNGQYVRNARPVALKATLAGDVVTLVYNKTTESLRRLATTTDATTTIAGGGSPSTNQSRGAFPVLPPTAEGGTKLTATPKTGAKTAQKATLATVAKAGMRLTFFLGSSTTQRGAVPVNPNDVTSSAGAGYVQVNVLDVTNGQATTEVRQYLPDSTLNSVYAATTTAGVVSAENGGDGYWRSPAELAAIKDQPKGDETVVRLSYPLDGTTYNAIRITTKANASTVQNTYDLDSGVLLSYGFNGTGANGSAQVVQMLFKGARQLHLPWIGQQPAPNMTGLKRLSFSGQYATTVDNSYSMTSPMTQDWDITKVDVASVQFVQSTTLTLPNAAPNQSKNNLVFALSALWISPKILGSLRAGQVLDEDPITHGQVKVFGSQNGTMVIGEQNSIQAGASAYDVKTGIVSALQTQLRLGLGTTTVFLQRTS